MWWDGFPSLALPNDPMRGALHETALETMRRTLSLDSIACQEGGLHGRSRRAQDDPVRTRAGLLEFVGRDRTPASPIAGGGLSAYLQLRVAKAQQTPIG